MARRKSEDDVSRPPELARLPPGRHGLPREFVSENHHGRLIAACVQEVERQGYVEMTVADVIKAAAVSRRTFYEFFDSKEACFRATYDLVFGHMAKVVREAYEDEEEWPERMRAALTTLLRFLAEDPPLARLCMVEPLIAGPPLSDHHREGIGAFSPMLDAGGEAKGSESPAPGTAEFVAAGAASLVIQWILAGDAERLEELLPALLESVLAPYLGPAEAERIARE